MQDFLRATRFLLRDLASTVLFLALFLVTHNTVLSVAVCAPLGVIQIAIQLILIRGEMAALRATIEKLQSGQPTRSEPKLLRASTNPRLSKVR